MPVEDVEGFDDLCDEFKSGEIDAVESGSDYDNEPPLDDRQDFERFIEAHDSLQTSQAQSPKCASLISFQAQAVVSLPVSSDSIIVVSATEEEQHRGIALADKVLCDCPTSEAIFLQHFRNLAVFHEANGHFSVNKIALPKLGKWVENLRSQGVANPMHRQALDQLGFVWNVQDAQWDDKFYELVALKAEQGHCRVVKRNNPGLYAWLRKQRALYNNCRKGKRKPTPRLEQRFVRLREIGCLLESQR